MLVRFALVALQLDAVCISTEVSVSSLLNPNTGISSLLKQMTPTENSPAAAYDGVLRRTKKTVTSQGIESGANDGGNTTEVSQYDQRS